MKPGRPPPPRLFLTVVLLWLSLVGTAAAASAATAEQVTLQLKWHHQFQFAGYYAALEKGYYRDAGLDVRIEEAKQDTDVVADVTEGRAQFAVGTSALVLARAHGKPVVVLAVIFQHSPLVLLARSDTGIDSVHDLIGKKLMLERHADELLAYLHREGVSENSLQMFPHSFDPGDLVSGKVDATSAYSTDEPFFLTKAKLPFRVFTPRSAGIDFYGDNLFTSSEQLQNHPDRVKAFREASLRGWKYAMAHPEEVTDLIVARYPGRHDRDYLLFEAAKMQSLILPGFVDMGYMFPGRWQHIADVYGELKLLPKGIDLDGFLFAPEASSDQERRRLFIGIAIALCVGIVSAGIAISLFRLTRRLRREMAARERAVAELKESESNFRFIAENTHDVIWIMNIASGRFTYVSPSVQRLRGFTAEEIMAQPVEAALTPESFERVSAILTEAVAHWEAGEQRDTMAVTEVDQPHKDGHIIQTEVVTTLHADVEGRLVSVLGVTRDVTERKRSEAEIRSLAFYDPLTQLANRRLLLDRLANLIARAKRQRSRLALLFIDLDKFKPINDLMGHEVGDWLLQAVGQRIQGCVRACDTVARIGGDEFVVLLADVGNPDDAAHVADKICLALTQPFVTSDDRPLVISASIGIAIYPDHGEDGRDLLRYGDESMYRAKKGDQDGRAASGGG